MKHFLMTSLAVLTLTTPVLAKSKANLNFTREATVLMPSCLAYMSGEGSMSVDLSAQGYKLRRDKKSRKVYRKSAKGIGADDADMVLRIDKRSKSGRACGFSFSGLRMGEAGSAILAIRKALAAAGYREVKSSKPVKGVSYYKNASRTLKLNATLSDSLFLSVSITQ